MTKPLNSETRARLARLERGSDMAFAVEAVRRCLQILAPREREPIISWVEHNIDLSYDVSSYAKGLVKLYPYQVAPLAAVDDPAVHEITLMWAPRMGKSVIWKWALLKRLNDGDCSCLMVYPSLQMGIKTNQDTVEPLLRAIPAFATDLKRRGNITKESYRLPSTNSIVYYLGSGTQIISYSANLTIGDELDQWNLGNLGEEGENIDNLRALRTRMQTFRNRLMIACSSPTTYSGLIYRAYKTGSRHIYHLRCLHCGNLSPSNQLAFPLKQGSYAGLQWLKDESENIITDSIRWICPICGHEHTEADAIEMASSGEYLSQNPDEVEHLSFQAGALSNPWIFPWRQIAEAQEEAVDTGGRKQLRNNILGMPYEPKRANDQLTQSIPEVLEGKKQDLPITAKSKIAVVTAGIDQQATGLSGTNYYVWSVRAWDELGNSWSVGHGLANTVAELDQVVNATYCGQKILLALMDAGGFAGNEQRTDGFIASHTNTAYYKGGDQRTLALGQGQYWRWSDNVRYLALCNALYYQEKLLDLVYGVKRPVGYEWHIPATPDKAYLTQIAAMRPNTRLKDGRGEAFGNWNHGGERHDYFDTEKMSLAALDVASQLFPPERWTRGKLPAFILAELLRTARK